MHKQRKDFRTSLKNNVPPSAQPVVDALPKPKSSSPSAADGRDDVLATPDIVPLSQQNTTTTTSSSSVVDAHLLEVTPSQRAAAALTTMQKQQNETAPFSGGDVSVTENDHTIDSMIKESDDSTIGDVTPKQPDNVIDLENPSTTIITTTAPTIPAQVESQQPTTMKIDEPKEENDVVYAQVATNVNEDKEEDVKEKDDGKGINVISGKAKLARVLGKNGFDPNSVAGKSGMDRSAFGKPPGWTPPATDATSGDAKPKTKKTCPLKHSGSTASLPSSTPLPSSSTSSTPSADVPAVVKPLTSSSYASSALNSSPSGTPASPTVGAGSADVGRMEAQVEALRTELASQTKWEAVRLQEAVRSQMVEDKKANAKELAALQQRHVEAVDQVRSGALAETKRQLSEQRAALQKQFEAERETKVSQLLGEREDQLKQDLHLMYSDRAIGAAGGREQALQEAQAKVGALSDRFDSVVAHGHKMKVAAKRISRAFLYRQAIANGESASVVGLLHASGGDGSKDDDDDRLVRLVTSPPSLSKSDKLVPSVDDLRDDLKSVAKHGLAAAVVPPAKVGSVWAHALAAAFSRMKVPVDFRADGRAQPQTDEERIRLAQWAANDGDLYTAVTALEKTSGLAKDVVKDWVEQAKRRLAATQAADVLMADAIIAQVALMK